MLILAIALLGIGTISLALSINVSKKMNLIKIWAFVSFIAMLFSWIAAVAYDHSTVKEALIIDGKAKYVCDKYGDTTLILIDSTCTEIFKFIKNEE